jgi:hypothetical protein
VHPTGSHENNNAADGVPSKCRVLELQTPGQKRLPTHQLQRLCGGHRPHPSRSGWLSAGRGAVRVAVRHALHDGWRLRGRDDSLDAIRAARTALASETLRLAAIRAALTARSCGATVVGGLRVNPCARRGRMTRSGESSRGVEMRLYRYLPVLIGVLILVVLVSGCGGKGGGY